MVSLVILHNLGVLALIGFLCWNFDSGWPCILVLCLMNSYERVKKCPKGEEPKKNYSWGE